MFSKGAASKLYNKVVKKYCAIMYSKLSVNVHFRKCFVHDLLWPKWFCAGIRLEQNDWVFFMGRIAEVVDRANNKF